MKAEDYGLTVVRIETDDHVETLRDLRNRCRGTFSYTNEAISRKEQAGWWEDNKEYLRAYLYYEDDVPAGFGVLRCAQNGTWYTTVGVRPLAQGRGLGKAITADLVRRRVGGAECIGIARIDNPAGQKLHRDEDWTEIQRTTEHILYRVKDTVPHAL